MGVLRFLSAGAAQALVRATAPGAGVEVDGSFGPVGAMLEKFHAREACDVVILSHAQIAQLVAGAEAVAGSSADLGEVATSIAVRAGEPAPDVSDEARLRAALLGADALYFPDPVKSTAGIHFAQVLAKLGMGEAVRARSRVFPSGASAMRELAASSGHCIGCTQSTEILATPGVRLAAALPRGFDLRTVYTAAVNTRAAQRAQAEQFVARLTGEGSLAARRDAGFGGYAIRPATRADEPAIRALVEAVLREYGLAPDPAGIDADLADLEAGYFSRGGAFDVVIASEGRLAGCCGVCPIDAQAGELRKMYLAPSARGHGLGSRLLARALAFARGRGLRRIELETASVLKDAIALYRRAGFTPIARDCHVSRCDQVYGLDLR